MKKVLLFAIVAALIVGGQTIYAQSGSGNAAVIPLFQGGDDDYDPEARNGFSFGLTMGVYFANKKSANFYNGSCSYQLEDNIASCYRIENRIQPASSSEGGVMSNNEYNRILDHYNASGMSFPQDMYPVNMRYQPSFMYGFKVKYNFNYTNSIVMGLNVANLKTVDVYTVNMIGTSPEQNEQNDTQVLDINGKEDRFQLTLGYRTGFETGPKANYFFEFGGSMLGTRVKSNEIFIADRSYELFIGADNPNQSFQSYRPRTEVGIGFYAATGWELFFNDRYEVEFGVQVAREPVQLGTYRDELFSSQIYLAFSI